MCLLFRYCRHYKWLVAAGWDSDSTAFTFTRPNCYFPIESGRGAFAPEAQHSMLRASSMALNGLLSLISSHHRGATKSPRAIQIDQTVVAAAAPLSAVGGWAVDNLLSKISSDRQTLVTHFRRCPENSTVAPLLLLIRVDREGDRGTLRISDTMRYKMQIIFNCIPRMMRSEWVTKRFNCVIMGWALSDFLRQIMIGA